MQRMPVQRLHPGHAAAYRALLLEAYELHPDAFTSSVAERARLPLSWWADRLGEDPLAGQVVFGAFREQELCGVAGISFETREKIRHKATLFGMYVPERHRRIGLGRELVRAVLDCAAGRPELQLVQLTVTEGNLPARRLYEPLGFSAFGTEPLAVRVGEKYVSKVHLWRRLRPDPTVNP